MDLGRPASWGTTEGVCGDRRYLLGHLKGAGSHGNTSSTGLPQEFNFQPSQNLMPFATAEIITFQLNDFFTPNRSRKELLGYFGFPQRWLPTGLSHKGLVRNSRD